MIDGIKSVRDGGKRALSEALALTEHSFDSETTIDLLDEAYAHATAHVVGFTGPPGVGKSTLINGLIKEWRRRDKTVGVIAIDPSSHKTGGALLGDRTRMITDPEDQGVFVRSLASRGQLGGVAQLTFPALVLMRALFDIVIIETVGVGQSEADITSHADSVILCVQPGSGDSLQFMKSGIMEIPDIAVVTKADMGSQARRAEADLKGALSITNYEPNAQETVVLSVSAAREEGLSGLIDAIDGHYQTMIDRNSLESGRQSQAIKWLKDRILTEYGTKGLSLVQTSLSDGIERPFKKQHFVLNGLTIAFKG
ncbi:MAG: methylmalonyl Co-A mutase-associated GTPase MeaB [Rhizobiales bacterium]|nr:methylmalonyl Co-A mutase-associated GTPase MeaB [Hyphomicrobiales bacterium]